MEKALQSQPRLLERGHTVHLVEQRREHALLHLGDQGRRAEVRRDAASSERTRGRTSSPPPAASRLPTMASSSSRKRIAGAVACLDTEPGRVRSGWGAGRASERGSAHAAEREELSQPPLRLAHITGGGRGGGGQEGGGGEGR